jgi:hypothetical protein
LEYLRKIEELRSSLSKEQQLRLAYEQELRVCEKEMAELRTANSKLQAETLKLNTIGRSFWFIFDVFWAIIID